MIPAPGVLWPSGIRALRHVHRGEVVERPRRQHVKVVAREAVQETRLEPEPRARLRLRAVRVDHAPVDRVEVEVDAEHERAAKRHDHAVRRGRLHGAQRGVELDRRRERARAARDDAAGEPAVLPPERDLEPACRSPARRAPSRRRRAADGAADVEPGERREPRPARRCASSSPPSARRTPRPSAASTSTPRARRARSTSCRSPTGCDSCCSGGSPSA